MIITKTPLRISFMGGGTDFEDFYKKYPGRVISVTIDKNVYLAISKKFSRDIRVSYSQTEIVPTRKEIKHTRVRAILEKLKILKGVEIVSIADLPSEGTGLASSSAFTAGLLKGLHAFLGNQIEVEDLARESCEVEIDMLGEPIGKQDQYAVAYGGLNIINFNKNGQVTVEPVYLDPIVKENFQKHLMFFYTSKTRSAKSILKEQKENIDSKIKVLKKMSDMVPVFLERLEHADFKSLGLLLHESWVLKRKLSSSISNNDIEKIYNLALKNGAWGGKILGAGGGGFLMLIAPLNKQKKIRLALSRWQEVKFSFSERGSEVVYRSA